MLSMSEYFGLVLWFQSSPHFFSRLHLGTKATAILGLQPWAAYLLTVVTGQLSPLPAVGRQSQRLQSGEDSLAPYPSAFGDSEITPPRNFFYIERSFRYAEDGLFTFCSNVCTAAVCNITAVHILYIENPGHSSLPPFSYELCANLMSSLGEKWFHIPNPSLAAFRCNTSIRFGMISTE